MKTLTVSVLFFCVLLLSSIASASEAIVLEVQIAADTRLTPPQTIRDLSARVRFTGDGSRPAGQEASIRFPASFFGAAVLDRIETLLVSALLSGKTVWISFDGSTSTTTATGVFLKS